MSHVATLICNPQTPMLDEDLVGRALQLLPGAERPIWLAPGLAADIAFRPTTEGGVHRARELLREAFAGVPIDVIVQPSAARRKKLLVADMDSTVIAEECVDELADFLGIKDHVAKITARAMRGEIAFVPALRERVALLAGLSVDVIEKVLARITFTPGAEILVRTMRAHGAYTALVSGGFTLFTIPLAARLGFDASEANVLCVKNGRLTGAIEEPVRGGEAKRATLVGLRSKLGLMPVETLAVGDGANDVSMLAEAGLGVAFRAKPAVAAQAHARIDHADLTALLYVQGYRREHFWQPTSPRASSRSP
ncbi:MAG TPA: phosphoserine phosphatase SerB [Methylovirgula sp.]|nr:phosphoserine phosphatase SerB [Methylovirgula sp.]